MSSQTLLLIITFLTAFVNLSIGVLAWRRRRMPGAEALSLLMLSAAAYVLPYTSQIISVNFQTMLFYYYLTLPGITAIAPLWFIFSLQVTGREKLITSRNKILLSIVPVFTCLLAWINGIHSLLGSNFQLVPMGAFSFMNFSFGLIWIIFFYSAILGVIGARMLTLEAVGRRRYYRGQIFWFLGGSLPPLASFLLFYLNISPIDLTSFSFLFSGVAWSIAVFRYGFLNIVPLARTAIFDSMFTGVIVLDHNDRVIDFNPAASSIIGNTEIKTNTIITDILPSLFQFEADQERIVDLNAGFHPGEALPPKYVEYRVSSLVDSGGRPVGKLVLLQDVTGRELAGMALQESEKDFRFLFDNVPVSLWEEDFSAAKKYLDKLKDGGVKDFEVYFKTHPGAVTECAELVRIVNVNETTVQMLRGVSKEDIAGILDASISPESFNLFKNELIALLDGETTFDAEASDKRLDGSEVIFRVHLSVAPGFEVSWEKVFVTVIDITEEKYAQQALAESEKRFRAIVDDQTELVHRFLPDGTITFANDAYCAFWGMSRNEIIGINFIWAVPVEYREEVRDIIAGLDITNPVAVNENPIINVRGEVRWYQWTNRAIFNANGEIIEYQAVARDITDRVLIENALQESEEKYRLLVENANEAIFVAQDGMIKFFNPMVLEIIGYSSEELAAMPFLMFIHPDDSAMVVERHLQRLKGGAPPQNYTFRVINKDGSTRWVEINPVLIEWEDRPATLNFLSDITERKVVADALRESENQMRTFFEYASVGMVIADLDGRFQRVNQALCEMLGYSEAELLEMNFMEITHPDDLEADQSKTKQLLAGEINNLRMEKRYIHKQGHYVWVMLNTALIRDAEGEPLRFSGQVHDISERKKSEEELMHLATYDILTDLPNRGLFFDRLDHAITNAKRTQSILAILFLDLDNFKLINDKYGHLAGDQVLKMVAERLKNCARESDTAARMGGDEFTVLLENLPDPKGAVLVAEKIKKSLAEPFLVDGKSLSLGVSLGISIYPQDGEDGEALLMKADAAMYRVKESNEAAN